MTRSASYTTLTDVTTSQNRCRGGCDPSPLNLDVRNAMKEGLPRSHAPRVLERRREAHAMLYAVTRRVTHGTATTRLAMAPDRPPRRVLPSPDDYTDR